MPHTTKMFTAPENADELFSLVRKTEERYTFVAGGVSVNWHGNAVPLLISLEHIFDRGVTQEPNGIRIGAGMILTAFEEMGDFSFPVLAALCKAVSLVASPQIRNMATLGGNLVSHFDFSDSLGFLYLMEPEIEVLEPDGVRTVPFRDFLSDRGRFTLKKGVVLNAFFFPREKLERHGASCYVKESRIGRDIASINLTILRHSGEEQYDIAVGCCWPTLQLFRGVAGIEEVRARLAGLSLPMKSDNRATAEYRQAILLPLIERGLKQCRTSSG
jgi:CO/xanthine dehydrogenase FAD-binding subunit